MLNKQIDFHDLINFNLSGFHSAFYVNTLEVKCEKILMTHSTHRSRR